MIPVLTVTGKTLPEAWERSVVEVWENGTEIRTEYDQEGGLLSRDCTMVMCVLEPMTEPRLHRALPCRLEDLEKYRQEVVDGVHDHWIKPEEGKWTYTYHQRLFNYGSRLEHFSPFPGSGRLAYVDGNGDGQRVAPIEPMNQIDYICSKLVEAPHSRRAQAITWIPFADPPTDDPPCLQRIWCRVTEDDEGTQLEMNTHWRSRDAYKAAFMNNWALTDLQRRIAERVGEGLGEPVAVGRYVDIVDSYHIYGSYFEEFERGFLKLLKERDYKDRVWTTEFAEPFFEMGREELAREKEEEAARASSS
ncbi:MAG: thymidylate synthase [Armatimonadota bacterium]|jgi:thymidylate synthase